MTRRRLQVRAWLAALLAGAATACSPALDWRQARPEGWSVALLMPCRPDAHERQLNLAGAAVVLGMLSCEADGHTFALASAELSDPSRVGPALRALAEAARANLQGQIDDRAPSPVKAMTPQPDAQRWHLHGALPDGRAVRAQTMVFAHGTRVFQATVIGARAGEATADVFFAAIEVRP